MLLVKMSVKVFCILTLFFGFTEGVVIKILSQNHSSKRAFIVITWSIVCRLKSLDLMP